MPKENLSCHSTCFQAAIPKFLLTFQGAKHEHVNVPTKANQPFPNMSLLRNTCCPEIISIWITNKTAIQNVITLLYIHITLVKHNISLTWINATDLFWGQPPPCKQTSIKAMIPGFVRDVWGRANNHPDIPRYSSVIFCALGDSNTYSKTIHQLKTDVSSLNSWVKYLLQFIRNSSKPVNPTFIIFILNGVDIF